MTHQDSLHLCADSHYSNLLLFFGMVVMIIVMVPSMNFPGNWTQFFWGQLWVNVGCWFDQELNLCLNSLWLSSWTPRFKPLGGLMASWCKEHANKDTEHLKPCGACMRSHHTTKPAQNSHPYEEARHELLCARVSKSNLQDRCTHTHRDGSAPSLHLLLYIHTC